MENPTRSATEETVAEHIPWEHLTVATPPDRSRLLYGLAALIGIVVIGVVAGRAVGARPGSAFEPEGSSTTVASLDVEPSLLGVEVQSLTDEPASPVAAPTDRDPLSEADLLAFVPVAGDRVAATRAEWFVVDYFGFDGSGDRAARVAAAGGWLPTSDAAPAPEPATAISYVEWASAVAVDQVDLNRFEVTVVFRRYVAADALNYHRLPVEAARLTVTVDQAGGSAIVDWPILVDIPVLATSALAPPPPTETATDAAGITWPLETEQATR